MGVVKLVQDIIKSGYQPDVLIGISKGGVVMASLMSDMLGIPTDLIQMAHWGFGRAKDDITIKYRPSIDVKGLRVLLIDDVSDTGLTLSTARELLIRLGARDVKTAVLDYKAYRVGTHLITTPISGLSGFTLYIHGRALRRLRMWISTLQK